MEAKIYNKEGKEAGKIDLPKEIFGLRANADLVHQVFTSMNSNMRANTAKVKDRSEVSGTGKKPWQQKGTGRARHGSKRSPIWVKGGVAHGPTNERNFKKKINKKMNAKALFTVLSEKFRSGQILFVDDIAPKEIKTKDASKTLKSLSQVSGFDRLSGSKKKVAHIAVSQKSENLSKSFKNIQHVEVDEVRNLNVTDVLNRKYLIIVNPKEAIATLSSKIAK
ncbi:MAG: 50S ribosomal protein L4 [Bacteroidetes bacterium]|nr:50S ribosomal protein L4 [Bacteroidota bacterium]